MSGRRVNALRKLLTENPRTVVVLAAIAIAVPAVAIAPGALTRNDSGGHATAVNAGAKESNNSDELDWDRPMVDGVDVGSVESAASQLPFRPVTRGDLGRAKAVLVHGGDLRDLQPAVDLVFSHPKYGRFVFIEQTTSGSQADLERLAAECAAPDACDGTWSMITLPDGTRALLIDGSPSVPGHTDGVLWQRNGVSYDVFGPSSTFSAAFARELAAKFAAAGA